MSSGDSPDDLVRSIIRQAVAHADPASTHNLRPLTRPTIASAALVGLGAALAVREARLSPQVSWTVFARVCDVGACLGLLYGLLDNAVNLYKNWRAHSLLLELLASLSLSRPPTPEQGGELTPQPITFRAFAGVPRKLE